MKRKNKIFRFLSLLAICSCNKTVIQFGSDGVGGDPNITMIDTVTVNVSTLQVDSFATGNSNYFIAGSHIDPQLGYIESRSYFEITAPVADIKGCSNCVFDSIVLNLQMAGGFMGDTTVPFTLSLHEVTQSMDDDELSTGYNVSYVSYNTIPLASKIIMVKPGRKDSFQIRLPDDFGKNIFRMLKTGSDTITNTEKFARFLKGMCLATVAGNDAVYYFKKTSTSLIQLHYTLAGATPVAKTIDLDIKSSGKQFNSFSYDKSGTPIAAFTPKKLQLLSSTATNGIGYLHYNSGLFPKISFGSLLFLKELHPYIQVLKAELLVYPVKNSYGQGTLYSLPEALELRATDDDNYVTGAALAFNDATQYGSLYIDNLYGENTGYSYDVTSFVNTILSEGAFSRRALLLYPYAANDNSSDQRLLLSNALSKQQAIKLKLYVLGL